MTSKTPNRIRAWTRIAEIASRWRGIYRDLMVNEYAIDEDGKPQPVQCGSSKLGDHAHTPAPGWVRGALAEVDRLGFGENVDADSIIESAARAWLHDRAEEDE